MSEEAFDALMPAEFWREVVDRVAVEVPGTLLLAEAFWLLESYFVRTLGMHRVYNSAFMNMLRDEENAKYRSYLKKTVEFDPDILKRYVNFMSNPDERTATDQFGEGDKFFGVSVLLATLPGLPMFGHGQIEGYTERYGMDFKQARLDERPNEGLVARHQQLIAPLLKNRQLFAESANFVMYDFWTPQGDVDESVFAYSNMNGGQRGVVLYNNRYGATRGTIKMSVAFLSKESGRLRQTSLSDGLQLPQDDGALLAYRDMVQGLEYLRRARDLRDHGFTMDLRGYQHVVLLDWRELWPNETHPWDRLCDALNGAGVTSVDEALQQLRLQPVIEALQRAISPGNVQAFAKAAEAAAVRAVAVVAKPEPVVKAKKGVGKQADVAVAETTVAEAEVGDFVGAVAGFVETARALMPEEAATGEGLTTADVGAVVELPRRVSLLPKVLHEAAKTVLPSGDVHVPAAQVWAPVMAWLAVRSQTLERFDGLRLRHALAEAFAAAGLTGEDAWRAAARVRLLLQTDVAGKGALALREAAIWQDADVRWLTGLHAAQGTEFFAQEGFEALLGWLQLPTLLAGGKSDDGLVEMAEAAKDAGYELRAFLSPGSKVTKVKAKSAKKREETVKAEPVKAVPAKAVPAKKGDAKPPRRK
jgi:hypothetical protein